jgi:hypothetical protein
MGYNKALQPTPKIGAAEIKRYKLIEVNEW